jgi:hypothetical protein
VRHGGLTWHSSQRKLLAERGMTATPAHGMKSSILVATTISMLWIWLTDDIPEGMYSSLICHYFDMCLFEMITNLVKISQRTQSIESPINSSNSWVCCSRNNLTTSNHEMTQKVHNMYYNFIRFRLQSHFQTYIIESFQSYYLPVIGLFHPTYLLVRCIKINDVMSLHKTYMLLTSLIHHIIE